MARTNTNSGMGGGGVTSFNGLTGAVTLSAGLNVTLNTVGNDITINSSGGGGGVTSLNTLIGAITLVAGNGISIFPVGNTLSINAVPGPNNWSTFGNSGLTNGINFLGTLDDIDVVFKQDNVISGRLNQSAQTTSFGYNSATDLADESGVTAFGFQAGSHPQATTNGINSSIFGANAGINNSGDSAVIIGVGSGGANTGENLTTVGSFSTGNNTGTNVTVLGTASAVNNPYSNVIVLGANADATMDSQFAISPTIENLYFGHAGYTDSNRSVTYYGFNAGVSDTDNSNNTGIGQYALASLPANGGFPNNTAVGTGAGSDLNYSINTTIVGAGALSNSSTLRATNTVAIGTGAGQGHTDGNLNTYVGHNTGETGDFDNVIALGAVAFADNENQFSIAKGAGSGVPEIAELFFPLNSTGAETGYVLTNVDGNGHANWQPAGGGGGSITAGQVGYGDPSNLLTSDSNFTWDSVALRFLLGDLTNAVNETKFYLLDDQASITATARNFQIVNTSVGGGGRWYYFDGSSGTTSIGDVDSVANDTLLTINDFSEEMVLQADNGVRVEGVTADPIAKFDPVDRTVELGNYTLSENRTVFRLDDVNSAIDSYVDGTFTVNASGGDNWFTVSTGSHQVDIGDAAGAHNSTFFSVNDSAQNITASTDNNFYIQDTGGNQVATFNPGTWGVRLGDTTGFQFGTQIVIEDTVKQIRFITDNDVRIENTSGSSGAAVFYPMVGAAAIGDINHVVNDVYLEISNSSGGQAVILHGALALNRMQVHTAGGNVTINDGDCGIYYDPATLQAAATITLPLQPYDGTEVVILFGGTIATGAVVTTLTIAPNTSQTLVGTPPATATANTSIKYKFRDATNQWYPST